MRTEKHHTFLFKILILSAVSLLVLPLFFAHGQTECTDSDGGQDYYEKGITSKGGVQQEDHCLGGSINEFFCNRSGDVDTSQYRCPHWCEGGACGKPNCTDSDGNNPYIRGYVEGRDEYGGEYLFHDNCSGDGLKVNEYVCGYKTFTIVVGGKVVYQSNIATYEIVTHDCPSGCGDGVCLESLAPTCTDTDPSNDKYVEGKVYGIAPNGEYYEYQDSCTGYNKITQFWCYDNPGGPGKLAGSNVTYCEEGCREEGVCAYTATPDTTCNDTDRGLYYSVKGTTTWGPIEGRYYNATDECDENGQTLSEFYCEGGYSIRSRYNCPYGCEDGACVPEVSETPVICSDTDMGLDYYTKGTVTLGPVGGVYKSATDYCADYVGYGGRYLSEYYCDGSYSMRRYYKCPYGCEDGACLTEFPEMPCNDTDGGKDYYVRGCVLTCGEYPNGTSACAEVCDECVNETYMDMQTGQTLTRQSVLELYCGELGPDKEIHECPYGCEDGACIGSEGKPPIMNKKDPTIYSEKEVFLISDKNWRDVLSLVPVTTWTDDEDNIHKYPTLIYHEEDSGFDADSIIYFMQQYSPDMVTVVGETPQELDNLLIADPELGAGLQQNQIRRISPGDIVSCFESYKDIVYVQDDYGLALLASTYASLINAPLVIEGTEIEEILWASECMDSDGEDYYVKGFVQIGGRARMEDYCGLNDVLNEMVCVKGEIGTVHYSCPDGCLEGACVEIPEQRNPGDAGKGTGSGEGFNKNIICVGKVDVNCDENYNLEQLQQKYIEETNTDKIILVNPNDLDMKVEEEFAPEKSSISINEIYSKNSLAAPILASGKHELIISTTSQHYVAVDDFIENRISVLNVNPEYLTIVASPNAIDMSFPYVGKTGTQHSADAWHYSKIDDDPFLDLAVGRIFGITISDSSSNIARSLFYEETLNNEDKILVTEGSPYSRSAEEVYLMGEVLSVTGYDTTVTLGGTTAESPEDWENKFLIFYIDHGSPVWAGIFYHEIPYLDNSFVVTEACATCDFEEYTPKSRLFCSHVIRKGGIGYIGATDVTFSWNFPGILSEIFSQELTIGKAFINSKNSEIVLDGHSEKVGPYYREEILNPNYNPMARETLLGDPTLKLKTIHTMPKPQFNFVSGDQDEKSYKLIVPAMKVEAHDCESPLYFTTAHNCKLYFNSRFTSKFPVIQNFNPVAAQDVSTKSIVFADEQVPEYLWITPYAINATAYDYFTTANDYEFTNFEIDIKLFDKAPDFVIDNVNLEGQELTFDVKNFGDKRGVTLGGEEGFVQIAGIPVACVGKDCPPYYWTRLFPFQDVEFDLMPFFDQNQVRSFSISFPDNDDQGTSFYGDYLGYKVSIDLRFPYTFIQKSRLNDVRVVEFE